MHGPIYIGRNSGTKSSDHQDVLDIIKHRRSYTHLTGVITSTHDTMSQSLIAFRVLVHQTTDVLI
eukprot:c33238_g1_i1 orf=123-317(+)